MGVFGRRAKQALEEALDAVVSIDADNNVTGFNAAAERLWGYSRDHVIGNNVKMLVPNEIRSHGRPTRSSRSYATTTPASKSLSTTIRALSTTAD